MKKQIYLSLVFVLFSVFSLQLVAQSFQYEQFKFIKSTKIRGPKIFFNGLENTGEGTQIDISKMVEDYLGFYFATHNGVAKKKIQNHISWMTKPLFEKTNDKSSADVIVGGSYSIATNAEVEEKLLYERAQNVGGAVPYYEIRQINRVEIIVVISYTYKDKTVDYDTLRCVSEYERKPGTKYKSIDDLLVKCQKSLKTKLYDNFRFYDYSYVWYRFKKVKTKDKDLKSKLKTVSLLLSNGDIDKAARLFLQAYELDNSNLEAAFDLAQCYELVGNYPKALEFYKKSPDFHAKVRMKSNMILYNYLNDIEAKLVLTDF